CPLTSYMALAQPPNLPGAGNCLSFNGTSDYVDLGDPAILQPANVTVEAWFNTKSSSEQYICRKRTYGYTLAISAGNVYFLVFPNAQAFMAISTNIYNDGLWHFASGVYDSNNSLLYIYVDGILVGSTSTNGFPLYYQADKCTIGRDGGVSLAYFSGQIDEVRIYNRALTQTEIRDNMCQKLTGNEAGLVGYWRFDETSGTTANDSQTNVPPNNGTLK
ncbi:MAG: LamG domain-containing protein, partial [Bacteroidota bacterium]